MSDNIEKMVKNDNGYEGEIYFPLFNKNIKIQLDNDVSIEYTKKCVHYLQNLDKNVINDFCESSLKYFYDYVNSVGIDSFDVDMPLKINGEEILKYIYPKTLLISKQENTDIAFQLICDSKWDIEELSWMVRNGKTIYLGANYGKDQSIKMEEYLKNVEWNYSNLYCKKTINTSIVNNKKTLNVYNEKKKKKPNLILLILIFAIPFIIIIFSLVKNLSIRNYPSTYSTQILNEKCNHDSEYGTSCYAIVEYEVNNVKYKTKNEKIPSNYKNVLVYYNPDNPQIYYIENYEVESISGIVIGILISTAILLIIYSINKIRKKRNDNKKSNI